MTADSSGNVSLEQSGILLNLAGPEGVLARSLALFTGDEATPRACCVIALDELPPPPEPEEPADDHASDPWYQAQQAAIKE